MSLFIASLNSGSNGNCYYIGNDTEAVLIDVGISCREVEKRLKRLKLDAKRIKAIFVTHEHGDHIHGVPAFSRKHKIPVYITEATINNSSIKISEGLLQSFHAYTPITIEGLTVTGFPKYHDAADPYSFIVSNKTVKVGVFTDIGYACRHVIHHFQQCHAAFLEANYDTDMLESGSYPLALKNRIRNGKGHLSNSQAAKLFAENRPPFMSHLILSHLSKNNNKPKIVEDLFLSIAGDTTIIIASRNKETELLHIRDLGIKASTTKKLPVNHYQQLALF